MSTLHPELANKRLVLGLSGGVACYKAAELCRLLVQQGASVQVVMTQAAEHFITGVTMQALSGLPVYTSPWDSRPDNNMAHINLTRQADAVLIAPASAEFMAKLVHGRADDLLSLLCLARPRPSCPLLLAPAMNLQMYEHPATQRNLVQLQSDGATVLGVGQGEQACGESGPGRMLEPEELLEELSALFVPKVLAGQHVLVTAGPTYEAIDPVRGLTNRSSGKMGFAIARAAQRAGARVTLISGPVSLNAPYGVQRINVQSAQNMQQAVMQQALNATVFIATAAVADWRADTTLSHKLKKSGTAPVLTLVENPDILAGVATSERARQGALFCVGFAAETHDLLANAQAKRQRKGVPLLLANLAATALGQDDNALLLVDEQGTRQWPRACKHVLARQLIDEIAQRVTLHS